MSKGTLMPNERTTTGFSVAARSMAPMRVFSISAQTSRHSASDTSTAQPRYQGRNMKPRLTPPDSALGMVYGRPDTP